MARPHLTMELLLLRSLAWSLAFLRKLPSVPCRGAALTRMERLLSSYRNPQLVTRFPAICLELLTEGRLLGTRPRPKTWSVQLSWSTIPSSKDSETTVIRLQHMLSWATYLADHDVIDTEAGLISLRRAVRFRRGAS